MRTGPAVVLALALGAGCAVSEPGELDMVSCSDRRDNDGDELIDCDDPDCHVFEACRDEEVLGSGAAGRDDASVGTAWSGDAPAEPGSAGDGAQEPAPSSPPEDPPANDPEPAMPADDPPATTDPPAEPDVCDPAATTCPPPMSCSGVECPPSDPPPANWRITQLEAEVPKQTSYTLSNSADCVDPDSQCAVPIHLPPFVLCGCSPDPWVLVRVDGVEVGRTDVEVNATTASWTLDMGLALEPGNELRFEVMDRDLTEDQLVYTCAVTPDDALLASGMLGCEQAFTTDTGRRPFAVSVLIEPIEPL